MAPRVLFDTCALYGIDLADTFLRLAEAGSFEPKWSADVLEELRRNLIRDTRLSEAQVAKRIGMMEFAFDEARVTGYQHLEDSLTCDEKDRHVLAAAIHCGATDLVTFNLKDFPPDSTRPHGIRVIEPDEFLGRQFAADPETVLQVVREQALSKRRPPMGVAEVLDVLTRAGVPKFASEVRQLHGRHDPTAGVASARAAVKAPPTPQARQASSRRPVENADRER
jgi:predicted nucleic acid-binding protein